MRRGNDMQIYIMRHGETYWNKERLIQGSSDIELTDFGIELAEETRDGFVKDQIQFQRIYTSPYIRAVKTAEIINEKQYAQICVDPRIREMCFGKYEGQSLRELKTVDENIVNCFSKPSLYHPDETGESYEEVYDRVRDFLQNELLPLEQDPETDCVLVVCHGAVIRAFLTWIRHMELDEFWSIHQPNCSVNLIELKNGTFRSVKENIIYYESEEMLHRGIL